MVANRRPSHLVTDVDQGRLEEVVQTPADRLAAGHPLGQSRKQRHQRYRNQQLQDHELGNAEARIEFSGVQSPGGTKRLGNQDLPVKLMTEIRQSRMFVLRLEPTRNLFHRGDVRCQAGRQLEVVRVLDVENSTGHRLSLSLHILLLTEHPGHNQRLGCQATQVIDHKPPENSRLEKFPVDPADGEANCQGDHGSQENTAEQTGDGVEAPPGPFGQKQGDDRCQATNGRSDRHGHHTSPTRPCVSHAAGERQAKTRKRNNQQCATPGSRRDQAI